MSSPGGQSIVRMGDEGERALQLGRLQSWPSGIQLGSAPSGAQTLGTATSVPHRHGVDHSNNCNNHQHGPRAYTTLQLHGRSAFMTTLQGRYFPMACSYENVSSVRPRPWPFVPCCFPRAQNRSWLMAGLSKHVFNYLNIRGQKPHTSSTENEIDYSLTVSWNTIQTI